MSRRTADAGWALNRLQDGAMMRAVGPTLRVMADDRPGDDDPLVGVLDTADLAAFIVHAVNRGADWIKTMKPERLAPTRVNFRPSVACWEKTWGESNFWVELNDGLLRIGGNGQVRMPAELLPWLVDAVTAAAEWADDNEATR